MKELMAKVESKKLSKRSIWLGFASVERLSNGKVRLKPNTRRIAIVAPIVIIVLWLSITSAIYFLYKEKRGFDEISFKDVLIYPLKRSEIRTAQGEYDIKKAKRALEAGSLRPAFNLLRTGLKKSPENIEGRILLARFYAQTHPKLAIELLSEGLKFADNDVEYLRIYGQTLVQNRMDGELLELVTQTLSNPNLEVSTQRMMALFGMQAAVRTGQFELAPKYFSDYQLANNLEAILIAAQALNSHQQADEAIELLKVFVQRHANASIETAIELLIHLLIEENRMDDAVALALDYCVLKSGAWEPRITLLKTYQAAGRDEDVERESRAIARQFRNEEAAIVHLATFARDSEDIALARNLYESALENNFAIPRFGLLFVETHLTAGRYKEGVRLCAQIEQEDPSWLKNYKPEFASMRAIAQFGAGDPRVGKVYLDEFLADKSTGANVLLAVGRAFSAAGFPEQAYQIIAEAYSRDSENANILAELIDLQVQIGISRNLTTRISKLAEMRRISYEVFEDVSKELNSDRFLFAEQRLQVASRVGQVLKEREGEPLMFDLDDFPREALNAPPEKDV